MKVIVIGGGWSGVAAAIAAKKAGADILTYTLLDFLDSTGNRDIKVSCCNNAKMCCGEGVCGSCTARFSGHKVKRLCKVQADPRNIFEGRTET